LNMGMEERIRYTLENTEILKPPRRLLDIFGSTTVHYYLLTRPVYSDFIRGEETVIREGEITWGRPRIITPGYLLRTEGFSPEAREAFRMLAGENPNVAALLYRLQFTREPAKMEIVSGPIREVAGRIGEELEKSGDSLSTIIKGVDELWDVSLSKFIHEMVVRSAYLSHLPHMRKRGLIELDASGYPVAACDESGVPLAALEEIERLFALVKKNEIAPSMLKHELDNWGLFKRYEDRFLDLFRRK